MSLHRLSSGQSNIHVIHAFEFADSTDREAGTGYTLTAADVKKVALQLDDNSLWILTDDSPITWVAFGAPAFVPPMAWASRVTGQAIATGGSGSAISWTTEVLDNDGMIDIAGQPTRITVQTPGYYIFNASMQWDAGSGGNFRYIYFLKNGATTGIGAAGLIPSAGSGLSQRHGSIVTPPLHMNATDYIQLFAFHDNGSDRNFDNGFMACHAILLD